MHEGNDEFASSGELYRDVERKFWDHLLECYNDEEENDFGYSQYQTVFELLIPKIRQSAQRENHVGHEYDDRLREALTIIDDIGYALKAHMVEKKMRAWIWNPPSLNCFRSRPENWTQASPVDKSLLDSATAKYLLRPWMQLNQLDWFILNGYIFDEVARHLDGVNSGEAYGKIDWAYVASEGNAEKRILWRLGFEALKFAARWILVPAIAVGLHYFGYQESAKWLAVAYGIYVAIFIAFFPRRYLRRKALSKKLDKLEEIGLKLVNIYQNSSVEVFSPSKLRDQISKVEEEETFFRPAVYSILDRAIGRDAAVFALESRN